MTTEAAAASTETDIVAKGIVTRLDIATVKLLHNTHVITHRLCSAKSVPTPDEFTDAKKCSMPTSEIWCRFGSDLALMWRLYLAYAKSVPTPESWCQVSNQLSSVGIDLASILGLILADAKSVPTPEIWCRFSTDLAPILRLQLAYAKSMPTPEIWC